MFIEPAVMPNAAGGGEVIGATMVDSKVVSPQVGAWKPSSVSFAAISLKGVLLVTVMFSVSPGFTCRVGFSSPFGVIKQNSCLPAESVVVWYENWTFSTPF